MHPLVFCGPPAYRYVMPQHVRSRQEGPRGVITLDRPDRLHALASTTFDELTAALESLAGGAVTTVLLESTGEQAFSAGADLDEIRGMSHQEYVQYQRTARRAYDAIEAHPAIVLAAVDGLAHGGGFELVLAADLIVATERAEFALPEVKLGLTPGNGGTQKLPRAVGARKAMEMLTTGNPLSAREAERLGLVNRLVTDGNLADATDQLATQIESNAPLAVRSIKRLIREGRDASWSTALSFEQEVTNRLYTTDDAREGVDSFFEDRDPSFRGT